jgi:hypothetical protein
MIFICRYLEGHVRFHCCENFLKSHIIVDKKCLAVATSVGLLQYLRSWRAIDVYMKVEERNFTGNGTDRTDDQLPNSYLIVNIIVSESSNSNTSTTNIISKDVDLSLVRSCNAALCNMILRSRQGEFRYVDNTASLDGNMEQNDVNIAEVQIQLRCGMKYS